MQESLGQEGVSTNYSFKYSPKTWEFIQSTSSGNALFTQPGTPIKCAGAPQKVQKKIYSQNLKSLKYLSYKKDNVFGR